MMQSFKTGDKVIYPNQGIAVIESVAAAGENEGAEFYRLRLLAKSTLVMVPVEKAEEVGLRPIMTEGDVERVFDILERGPVNEHVNWKTRFKDNSDRMKSGSPMEVAGVLKGLHYLDQKKSLSFREKRMFDRAHQLTVTELAEVADESLEDVERKVKEALARSRGEDPDAENGAGSEEGRGATPVSAIFPDRREKRQPSRDSANGRRQIKISINRYY